MVLGQIDLPSNRLESPLENSPIRPIASLIHREFTDVRLKPITVFCGRVHICGIKTKQYHENHSSNPHYSPGC